MVANEAGRAMLQNEVDYPQPGIFMPERFLTQDGDINPSIQNPMEIVFGFGRRWVIKI